MTKTEHRLVASAKEAAQIAREIRRATLEEAAKLAQSHYVGDNTREDMEARRIAAAIRDFIPKEGQ